MSGEFASMAAANVATTAFTAASGGELMDTIVPIEIPAHRMIWAAAIGTTNKSFCTVSPNQVQSRPLSAT